jgi:hypothetical protein
MKIISFALWGDNPKYCEGAIKNAELAQSLFPDWECRFYVGTSVPQHYILRLTALANVRVINTGLPGDWRGMFWRFEAIGAVGCEAMISRDCDSRLSLREKAAVDEWLASPKKFHIMRDHPWHGSKMLGGMWGVKGPFTLILDAMDSWPQKDCYQTDQDFLSGMIYPVARHDAMIHAQFCAIEPDAIPFPSPRSGLEFVGQVFDENGITVAEHETMLMKALKMQGEPVRKEHLPECLQ